MPKLLCPNPQKNAIGTPSLDDGTPSKVGNRYRQRPDPIRRAVWGSKPAADPVRSETYFSVPLTCFPGPGEGALPLAVGRDGCSRTPMPLILKPSAPSHSPAWAPLCFIRPTFRLPARPSARPSSRFAFQGQGQSTDWRGACGGAGATEQGRHAVGTVGDLGIIDDGTFYLQSYDGYYCFGGDSANLEDDERWSGLAGLAVLGFGDYLFGPSMLRD
ncbi:unnamed protein product [Calypogeia fissa]